MELSQAVVAGDRRCLARALTLIENHPVEARSMMSELLAHAGCSQLIGVTGPPGCGKSTLVSGLVQRFRSLGQTVGILAVDPSSRITHGAILGDRVRMRDLAGDPGVFIRSMATRGILGGLARSTSEAAIIMDAAGFDRVVIETVGVGQSEVEIANVVHTTILVEAPGIGDDVQALKAGILEIADVVVVNKFDLPGANEAYGILAAMHSLGQVAKPFGEGGGDVKTMGDGLGKHVSSENQWRVPLLKTAALQGEGIDSLLEHVDQHYAHMLAHGELGMRQRARVRYAMELQLRDRLYTSVDNQIDGQLEYLVDAVVSGDIDPYSAADTLLEE